MKSIPIHVELRGDHYVARAGCGVKSVTASSGKEAHLAARDAAEKYFPASHIRIEAIKGPLHGTRFRGHVTGPKGGRK